MLSTFDINCDLGEGMDHDKAIMPFISSANIACGFHAGGKDTMRETIQLCLQYNVSIGAHPSYDDKDNFGRTEVHLPNKKIISIILEQLSVMQDVAGEAGSTLHHVKPHGALYNTAAKDPDVASAIVEAIQTFDPRLILYGLRGSFLEAAASSGGIAFAGEYFADRRYLANGHLVPRTQPHATMETIPDLVEQLSSFLHRGFIESVDGGRLPISAETICIHGDGTNAVLFAQTVHQFLISRGFIIRSIPS